MAEDENIEKRLQALEAELASARTELSNSSAKDQLTAKRPRPRHIFGPISIVFIIALVGSASYILSRPSAPLPASVIAKADFPVYYPSSLPGNYTFDKASATFEADVLIYKLHDSGKTIIIGQQARPDGLANLKSIDGMTQAATKLGVTYVNSKAASEIIMGEQTMITINGIDGASSKEIATISGSLEKAR